MTSSSLKTRLRPEKADFWNVLLPAAMREIDVTEEVPAEEYAGKEEL